MKELSIEEKAKRYDEVVARLRHAFNSNRCTLGFMNEILRYPKESEDERIRKELIEHVKDQQSSFISAPDCRDKYEEEENNKYNSWISWLEKQGNQNHIEQNLEMVEALRTEYEKGRADTIAEIGEKFDDCRRRQDIMGFLESLRLKED